MNAAAEALGSRVIADGFLTGLSNITSDSGLPPGPMLIAYALLWLLLIYFGVRLMIRLAYGLFRLMVALAFGPLALMLWAIPQTEWVTWLWLRELLGWSTTPLLVTACLAIAIPLASGRDGVFGALIFGIAGMQAAHDLVGLLGFAQRSNSLLSGAIRGGIDLARMAAAEGRADRLVQSRTETNAAIAAATARRYGSR